MFVIIKHLEPNVSIEDIENLAFIKHRFWVFKKRDKISAIKIIALENKSGKIVERHGLIRVAPDAYKKWLIKALEGRDLNGKKVLAAEYAIRHWSNDQRQEGLEPLSSVRKEGARHANRRRGGLNLITVAEKTYTGR